MNRRIVVLALLPLFAACASAPENRSQAEVDATVEDVMAKVDSGKEVVVRVNDEREVVCRREHVVGSRFPQRTCKTREQIELERKRSQETLQRHNDARNMSLMKSGPTGGG